MFFELGDTSNEQEIKSEKKELIKELSFEIPVNQFTIIIGTFAGISVLIVILVFVFSHLPHSTTTQFASLTPTPAAGLNFTQNNPPSTQQVEGINTQQQGPAENPAPAQNTATTTEQSTITTATTVPTATPTSAPASNNSSPTNTPAPGPTNTPAPAPTATNTPAPTAEPTDTPATSTNQTSPSQPPSPSGS